MAQQGSEQGRAGKKKKTNSLKPQYDPEDEAELLIEQDYYKQRPRILRLDKLTVEDVEDLNIKDFRLMNVALTVANLVQGNGGFDELVKVVPQTGIDAEGTAQYLEGDDYWEEFNCGRQHVTVGRCEREVLVNVHYEYDVFNEDDIISVAPFIQNPPLWFTWMIQDDGTWKEEACGMNIGTDYSQNLDIMHHVAALLPSCILHVTASEFKAGAKQFHHLKYGRF